MLNFYDYITNSSYYKTFRVDDLLVVEYKCLIPGDRVAFWTQNNYFAYILSGETKYYYSDKEYVVAQGDAMFVRRGAYVAEQHRKGDYCALVIFLSDDFIQKVVSKHPGMPVRTPAEGHVNESIFKIPVDESLHAYFHSVLSYFPKDTAPPGELLKLKFEELLLNILMNRQNPSLASCLSCIRECGKVSVREVMESSFMFPMNLDEYARLCARSLSTFKTDFQATYGMAPGRWLIRTRLRYAKILLETTTDPVNEISSRSGFRNTAHFVKVFKEAFGVPPLQYRLRDAAVQASLAEA